MKNEGTINCMEMFEKCDYSFELFMQNELSLEQKSKRNDLEVKLIKTDVDITHIYIVIYKGKVLRGVELIINNLYKHRLELYNECGHTYDTIYRNNEAYEFFDNLKNYFIETSPEYLYVLSYIKTEVVTKDIKHIMDYNLIGATYTQPLCYIHEM